MSKNITIDGIKCVVGLEWEGISATKSSAINGEIKLLSKKKGKQYGCKIVKERVEQIGFAEQAHKGILVPAVVLAKNYNDVVYFKKISEDKYWLCVINPQGNVLPDKEGVFDYETVVEILEELEMFGSVKILCSKQEKSEFYSEDSEDEDGPELEFILIDFKDILKKNKKDNEEKVHELITQSALLKNLISLAGLSIGGFLLYYFVIQTNPLYDEIINQVISEEIYLVDGGLKSYIDKNEEFILNKKIVDEGKIEFLREVNSNIYSKEEIKDYMTLLVNRFPVYLVEWQLQSVEFKKFNDFSSGFVINYFKIDGSNGYLNQIREELAKITKDLNVKDSQILINDLEGGAISLILSFNESYEESKLVANFESENLVKAKDKAMRDFQVIKDDVALLEMRVEDEFGFYDKRFGNALVEVEDEIYMKINQAREIAEKVKESYEIIKKQDIKIDDKYFTNKDVFLNIAQQNSNFAWEKAGLKRYYPKVGVEEGGGNAFASYTLFGLSSISGMSDSLKGLQYSLEVINKDWLTVKEINFNVQNKTWNIKGEYYEKNK